MLGFLKKFFLPDELASRPAAKPTQSSKIAAKPSAAPHKAAPSNPIDALTAIKNPDAEVRKAALNRIDDLTVLNDRAQNDSDAKIKQIALAKLKVELIAARRSVSERIRVLNVIDTATLEYVAKSAPEAELRRAALAKITRNGFLGDRAISDPDSAIRLELVARIEAPNTLERISDAVRTKDKAVYRAASEKLSAAKFAAGDQKELDARALALCTALEALLRNQPDDVEAKLAAIDSNWQSLSAKASSALGLRFLATRDTLKRILHPPEPAPVSEQTPDAPESNAAELNTPEPNAVVLRTGLDLELADAMRRISDAISAENLRLETLDTLQLDTLQRNVDARFAAIQPSAEDVAAMANTCAQLAAVRESMRAQAAQRQAKVDAQADAARVLIKQFADAVEAGDLAAARAQEKLLDAKKSEFGVLAAADKRSLGDAKAKLGKLLGWERWSANKHRMELCDEVQALSASGLHPDALQAKITELKTRWAELDKLDGLDAEAAKALGIGKRFRALCFEAIKPAQGYFDKRKELRGLKREETETLITRAQALLSSNEIATPKALLDARGDLSERMRNLDQLDPKARAVLSKQIREINDGLSEKLNEQRKAAETDKRKLVARLRRDLIGSDPAAAIAAAKTAQSEWKTLARADRKIEDELWAELRGLVDPHFASAKAADEKLRTQESEKAAAAEDIISRTRALVSDVDAEHSVASALEKLENEWRAHMQSTLPVEKPNARREGSRDGFRDDRGAKSGGKAGSGVDGRNDARNSAERDRERSKDRAFDAAVAQVRQATAAVEAKKLSAQAQLAAQKSALCLELESAWLSATADHSSASIDFSDVQTRWDALGTLPAALESPLLKRFEATFASAQSGVPADAATLAQNASRAAAIAMTLEYLTGRESPEALKTERMQYQVQRLSAKLNQGSSESTDAEIARLRSEWLALGPLAPDVRAEISARIGG